RASGSWVSSTSEPRRRGSRTASGRTCPRSSPNGRVNQPLTTFGEGLSKSYRPSRAMVSPVASLPPHLAYAMEAAGNRNGVDFDYLVQTAIRESSLNPEARAQSSSATGLFQFIESTWLEV